MWPAGDEASCVVLCCSWFWFATSCCGVLGGVLQLTLRSAYSINNLAALYQTQGRLQDAETLFRESLEANCRLHAAPVVTHAAAACNSGAKVDVDLSTCGGVATATSGVMIEALDEDSSNTPAVAPMASTACIPADVVDHPDVAAAMNNLW